MSAAASTGARAVNDAKVKRQKQILAVGSVILLGLLGFELPKLLGNRTAQPSASSAVAPALPSSPLAPTPSKLPDTDRVVIEPQSGQLLSFGLFKSKDPFVQQLATAVGLPTTPAAPTPVTTAETPAATTSQPHTPPVRTAPNGGLNPASPTVSSSTVPSPSVASPSVTSPTSTVPLAPVTTPSTPSTPPPTSSVPASTTPAQTTPAVPATAPTSVAIATNGFCELVAVKGTFPGSEDIFRLLSVANDGKSAKIGIVGGAYDSGQSAATLKLNEKLTLVNTADGTRYVLVLKSACDVETQPLTTTTTTPTTTAAVIPPATTAPVTTPIITDALDTTTPSG